MALRPWQEFILRTLFGTLDRAGKRKISKCLLLLPRGSGKTQLAAMIAIYSLLGLPGKGQEILSIATSEEQAKKVFTAAKAAIESDKYLSSLCEIVPSTGRIVVPHKSSYYAAMATCPKSGLGYNPNILIIDELEAFAGNNVDHFYNVMSSMGKRTLSCPLTIMLATGSTERNQLFLEELDYAKKIEAGVIDDPSYFPYLRYAKDTDDWTDEKVWKRVHPAAGDFFDLSFLRRECEQAKLLPSRKAVFCAHYLNMLTESQKTWIPDSVWMRNSEPPQHDPNTVYTAGLDLAAVRDSNALVLYGKRPDGRFNVIPFWWIAESQIGQKTSADQQYATWVKQGYLRATQGETANQEEIFQNILEICGEYNVTKIACDPYGARQWLAPALLAEGLPITYLPQNVVNLSEALKTLERQALNAELCHGGNPVLRWQLSCAWMRPDANGNYFLNKGKSTDQVDGVAALANAIAAYQYEQLAPTEPVVKSAASLLCFV